MATASTLDTVQKLGEYIAAANPFTQAMDLRLDQAEVDTASFSWPHREWPFKKDTYHITHALRIPYYYTGNDSIPRKKYLLVGFTTNLGE